MPSLQFFLVAGTPLLLLSFILIPSAVADRRPATMRGAAISLSSLTFMLSLFTSGFVAFDGPIDAAVIPANLHWPVSLGVYVDSLAAVMQCLISFVGLVIVTFSVRYLDRESGQGRFLKWILMTIGAVLCLVISRNLVMLTVAWMLTSYGLHKLLMHYEDRSWAVWSARKKFLISHLGDVMLMTALGLTWCCFGSVEYADVFAMARDLQERDSSGSLWISLIGSLYVLGAMTKSAQVPFHSWLPDTMEAPTPVSALMHAGIINAGGFLVLRLSPLISLSHLALDFLALIGALTAIIGSVVMLTQTSIKRQLAYSTVAQMGFMMLQCGLGAFSAALLHIVAHSLYKAHAFLSSGSVLEAAARSNVPAGSPAVSRLVPHMLPVALSIAAGMCAVPFLIPQFGLESKPGGPILIVILALALTQYLWPSFSSGSASLAARGVFNSALIVTCYFAAYTVSHRILEASASLVEIAPSMLDTVAMVLVLSGFLGIFLLQAAVSRSSQSDFLRRMYIHALNGFYFDIPARQITAKLWGHRSPVP